MFVGRDRGGPVRVAFSSPPEMAPTSTDDAEEEEKQ